MSILMEVRNSRWTQDGGARGGRSRNWVSAPGIPQHPGGLRNPTRHQKRYLLLLLERTTVSPRKVTQELISSSPDSYCWVSLQIEKLRSRGIPWLFSG